MARGWESKAVEAQQQDRAASTGVPQSRPLTPEERSVNERRRTLELARARTLADLSAATSDRHRAMLQRALTALDEQLCALP